MTQEGFKHKLAAIVSADVEGYSRLMQHDEIATIETLKDYRDIMSNLIKRYNGRVVDTTGDNLLAEFGSVVAAVECAATIQEQLKTRNIELSEDRRMEFRIGVNLGEVVRDEDRIYGDGVNIAARIEGLAKGGGICISRNVYDQVKNKLKLKFEYIGEHSVKNIAEPIHPYRSLTEPEDSMYYFGKPIEKELPEKSSIAVLTFDNMSGDPTNDYLCDGITEAIITGLASIPLLFVIARNSSAAYKGKSVNIQKVGRELGVQYVMEGSVQKSGNRLRITAQLIDSITKKHLWADRYEGILEDVFALQDEITVKILSALQLKLEHGHKANIWVGATNNLSALTKYIHSHDLFYNKGDVISSRKLCEEAHELDTDFLPPHIVLGWLHLIDFWLGLTESPKQSIKKALDLGEKTVKLNSSMAPAYSLLGKIYFSMEDYEKGIATARRAVEINPNEADCHAHLGCILSYSGYPEEALYWINTAVRLNPISSWVYFVYYGLIYNILGRYEEAIQAYKKVLTLTPDNPFAHIGLVEGHSLSGNMKEAHAAAKEVYRVFPIFSAQYHVKAMGFRHEEDTNRYLKALQNAGLK